MTEEIEITQAMIAAGESVIWQELCGAELPAGFSAERIARRVFVEMAGCRIPWRSRTNGTRSGIQWDGRN